MSEHIRAVLVCLAAAALAPMPLAAGAPPAQSTVDPHVAVPAAALGPWAAKLVPNPDDPAVKAYAARQKTRVEMERRLRRIRAHYFGHMRNVEIRQIGISKLRQFTDPIIFPSLLEIFRREKEDVRGAVLDHLADQGTDEADATLAWAAIFDEDKPYHEMARDRLLKRAKETGEVGRRVKVAIAEGLQRGSDDEMASAAELANVLDLAEAIPMLIQAQIGVTRGGAATSNGGERRALADIIIGTQQAFVSDLQPVVGDNAVAFDPTLSVVTSGTVLRIFDAYVVTYHTDVHRSLVGLSTRAWGGQSTASLGWDNPAWRTWYANKFLPYLDAKKAAAKSAAGADGSGGAKATAKGADADPSAETPPGPADPSTP